MQLRRNMEIKVLELRKKGNKMKTDDFDYNLPEELIAKNFMI